MSRKHFSWLLFVTFIVAAAVLMVPGKTGRESGVERSPLLPGLAERVNEVAWLRIGAAGDETVATLKREGEAWVVEEASGYPADWPKLKTLLSDLALAEVVEAKTANPDYYARLGVEDTAGEDAAGTLIEFAADSGLPGVIVGNDAQARDGQYVRLRDSAGSVLIDRSLDLPGEATGWLDRNVVDVSGDEAVEATVVHPDGETVRALKASADDEHFELQDQPEGREVRSEWTVDSLANGLSSLTLDDVSAAGDLDWSEPVRYSLLTADGLLLEADLVEVGTAGEDGESTDGQHWIRIEALVYTTAVESDAPSGEESADTSARAAEINARAAGWAYRIPQYKYDGMTKRMADLLAEPEES